MRYPFSSSADVPTGQGDTPGMARRFREKISLEEEPGLSNAQLMVP
ncbi:hypothetical protein IMZ48_09280 [Candidatus Bathyarchaeota archaeon]|nr:hypothetical protein [Candidatus Bathyarchaeota archaeon]